MYITVKAFTICQTFTDKYIFTGSGKNIQVWDTESWKCVDTVESNNVNKKCYFCFSYFRLHICQ